MPVLHDLLERRSKRFVLWVPGGSKAPRLILGTFTAGNVSVFFRGELSQALQDLWELAPQDIHPPLEDGKVYHYQFEVDNTRPGSSDPITVTDPLAYTVDYRVFGDQQRTSDMQPPAVIKYREGKLWPCDIDGKEPEPISPPSNVPANNRIVIYELPTSWSKSGPNGTQVDRGTFTDVLALFDKGTQGQRFASISAVKSDAILSDLGVNALELLPIADSKYLNSWGYSTAHYFAPDADLGTTASLIKLVKAITPRRLILDTVMAFGHDPYAYIAFQQFHLVSYDPQKPSPLAEPANPDSKASNNEGWRNDYGGSLWRYISTTETYDPQTGNVGSVHPSWSFHKAHLHRWLLDFGVSGFRLDSINNVANYDFIKSYKDYAWQLHTGAADQFIVIGEELSVPKDLLATGTLNALWNEPFKGRLRSAILGESTNDNFEWTVKKMINCTLDGYTDGAQAVNYITSHDIGGYRNERLYNFLSSNNVTDIERRAKLAFACLLTAVGIPMIFAGEEFVDRMDLDFSHDENLKQTDPVNYERKNEDWRSRVFDYVARLVDLRKNCSALGLDDTSFIHVDNSRGGKVLVWVRGTDHPVVVVANFTDEDTPGEQYYVPNWPDRNRNDWREITQNRAVPAEWVGREPLKHWEALVYTYWKE